MKTAKLWATAEAQRRLAISGGVQARIGALDAGKQWCRSWRMTTGDGVRV
jgi:hypothetical protein